MVSPSEPMSSSRHHANRCAARSKSLNWSQVAKSSASTTSRPDPVGSAASTSTRTSRPAAIISSGVRRSHPASVAATPPPNSCASSGLRTSPSHSFGAYNLRTSASLSTSNMPCFGSYQRCMGSSMLPPKRHGKPHVTCGKSPGSAVSAFKILHTSSQRTSSPSMGSPCLTFCVSMITSCP